MNVEPNQHIELDIPENVHEIILVEDGVLGKIRSKAYKNASTLYFFAILWFLVLLAEAVAHFIWE